MNDRVDRVIDRAAVGASILLLVIFAGTLGLLAWPRLTGALGVTPAPAEPAYRAGAVIDTPAEWYQAAPYTLLLFARASCSACQTAQPFFKRLIDDIGATVRVVLITSAGEADEDAQYARGLGLQAQSIRTAIPGLGVRVTPTLVLVDRQGTILNAWEGVGPVEKQTEIADALTTRLASPPVAGPGTPSAAQSNR
ncbi:MAG TPA: conjugal transfer protein TraF [Vicinamibacterales bacterium]|nr:conjugal transfer protein TraF [Vicinamibacterales bacterium]